MSEPCLAEIRIFGFNFPPRGWAFCDGQILPINQNQSLFSLLGTTYGGDGRTSFALPDLRGRVPVHVGTGFNLGSKSGVEGVALAEAEIPAHVHGQVSRDQATDIEPSNSRVLASRPRRGLRAWTPPANLVALGSDHAAGGGQSHENMQPFIAIHFCIALLGLFPSRN